MSSSEAGPARLPGEDDLIAVLAAVYRGVDWRAQGGKDVLGRWSGMLLVASRAGTVGELVDRLCARLGVASLPPEAAARLDACRPHARALLDLVAAETVPVAMAAYVAAKTAKERR